ncbi:MAG: AAA family ATPase [Mariprofundaceae bacterium]|nr:AAA family ATPase [Mariprofundaceae bacterium]
MSKNNLQHIKVEGFKSIQKLDLAMENINILIGANGAGKTNFISLFTFLSHLSQTKLKSFVAREGGAERFFHFGSRNTDLINMGLSFNSNAYHVSFSPNVDDDSLVFEKEYCQFLDYSKHYDLYPKQGESGFQSGSFSASEGVKGYTKQYLEKCRVYHFHDTSSQAQFKKTNKVNNHSYLEKNAENLAPFLYRLKYSDRKSFKYAYNQIILAIQSVAPFFHDFYLEPSGEEGDENILLRWTHQEHEAPFSANILSDGTARFICMATLFLQPSILRPDTIILDEPELGLHPAALEVLADIIRAVSVETQVICSTQSVTFANQFSSADFIVVDADNGVSTFKRLEEEPLKHWLDDYGMGDVWAKNIIGGRPAW